MNFLLRLPLGTGGWAPRFHTWPAVICALLTAWNTQANPAVASPPASAAPAQLRFRVELAPALRASHTGGRLFVILGRTNDPGEPRLRIGETGLDAPPFVARDVQNFSSGDRAELGREHAVFPWASLDDLPAGRYRIQALLSTNRDLRGPNSPGAFYSRPVLVTLKPEFTPLVEIALDQRLPEESLPPDTEALRFLKVRSTLLSEFHGRPIHLRAAVVLPRSFPTEPSRRYPLVVMTGGFGERFYSVTNEVAPGGRLAEARASGPETLLLQLDGAGPWGDPYQVNSANNGPYGDALVQELIPYVEQVFRGIGQPHARLLTGGSTGGWVSLALQIFYPDYFGGCWAGFPDSPDFRALQLVNLYADTHAYVSPQGFDRPSKRLANGDVAVTMRHELQLENALGLGNSFAASGGQWGSWAAVYGPRGQDGTPEAPWDPRTGEIHRPVIEAWRLYDLRHLLDRYWTNLAPRIDGKIHAWVGTADDYFLDTGLRLLATALSRADPPLKSRVHIEPGVGHGWNPQTWLELLQEMERHMRTNAPKSSESARDALMRAKYGHGLACPHCRGGR